MFKISYGHLYNTTPYAPPSVNRQISRATPNGKQAIGEYRMRNNANAGGASDMNNLMNNKLKNRDVYNKMKNKTVFGTSSRIRAHAELNQL